MSKVECDCLIGIYENECGSHYESCKEAKSVYLSTLDDGNYWEVVDEFQFCPLCAKPIDWKVLREASGTKL